MARFCIPTLLPWGFIFLTLVPCSAYATGAHGTRTTHPQGAPTRLASLPHGPTLPQPLPHHLRDVSSPLTANRSPALRLHRWAGRNHWQGFLAAAGGVSLAAATAVRLFASRSPTDGDGAGRLQCVYCSAADPLTKQHALFHPSELSIAAQRGSTGDFLASRLAAKVAACEALHWDLRTHAARITVRNTLGGAPVLHFEAPTLPPAHRVGISLSHDSGHTVATGFTYPASQPLIGGVGVDICIVARMEALHRRHGYPRAARHFLTIDDLEELLPDPGIAPQPQAEALAIGWSAKEAVIKALGGGIPPSTIALRRAPDDSLPTHVVLSHMSEGIGETLSVSRALRLLWRVAGQGISAHGVAEVVLLDSPRAVVAHAVRAELLSPLTGPRVTAVPAGRL
jgi:phosphopantetheinyl transferase (holo-ACP synthase)